MSRTSAAGVLALAFLWALPVEGAALGDETFQQQGTGVISGIVTDASQGGPVAGAQVSITGTGLGSVANAEGRYTIRNVPARAVTVRVQMIGFAPIDRRVTVAPGATVDVAFQLSMRALDLDAIVVTGTAGGLQRRAIGNVVTSVKADEVMVTAPVTNVGQLLGQRKPGVMMMPGTGQVGTGSAVRIRGLGSITQSTDPIVYIDGVRMDSNPRSGPAQRGGANQSRLNDIHPSDIESIEIIKGPAAATLYGTEASNGVIQIITKRGASGAAEFDVSAKIGTNWMWNPEGRASDMRWMRDPVTNESVGFNIYEHERLFSGKPFYDYGLLQSYNLSLRGGTDLLRYFTSISRDDDVGIVDWNWDKRTAMRVNLDATPTDKLTVSAGGSYIKGETRLSEGTLQTSTFHGIYRANPRQLTDARRGWAQIPPEDMEKVDQRSNVDRTTTSLQLRYKPLSWFTNRLVTGLDINSYEQSLLYPMFPQGASHFLGPLALGSKNVIRGTQRMVTVDYSGSGTFEWRDFSLQPSVGFQYYKTDNAAITAIGERFPALPITTVSGGSVRSSRDTVSVNATVGVFVQQQVGWNNRAFVTAAVRADDNSAFGSEFNTAIYPKLSGAWVISEEPFWSLDFVSQLRLRAAWGAAGRQPAAFAASRLYSPVIGAQNQPALVPSAYGNPDLKPERGEELEVGFDASFLDGRISMEFTRYQKAIKDAIIDRELSPSSGFAGAQIVNLGLIHSWGNELGVNARVLSGSKFAWDVDFQAATMENKIKDLGGAEVLFDGANSQHRLGYSIADIFMKIILDATINSTGQVLTATCDGGTGNMGIEQGGAPVPCAQAPQLWFGKSQPTWQLGLGNTFTLFSNLRLNVRVEGNGGHKQLDTSTRAVHSATTSEKTVRATDAILLANRLLEQDRSSTYDAGFLRLREISASYELPQGLVQRMSARRGSLSLGMRNVMMLWTAEHGWSTYRDGHIRERIGDLNIWDPETRSSAQGSVSYQTVMPPTASATMTLRFSF